MKFPYKIQFSIALIFMAFGLAGCGSLVKEVEYAPAPVIAPDAAPQPLRFGGLKMLLPPGMMLGNTRGGMFCATPGYPVNRNVLKKAVDTAFLRQNFHDAMEANGYDVTGSMDIVFDIDDEEQRADYSVAGTLKDVQLDMCSASAGQPSLLAPSMVGEHGRMYMAIEWSVYDRLKRTVVYKARSEGYTKRRIPNSEGMSLLFHDAFEMAAHNLAADEGFRALIVDGTVPPRSYFGRDARGEREDARIMMFAPDEVVTLTPRALSRMPFAKTAADGRKAVVMLQKGGHGSGVFITREGHILTNAHVVGEARKMRVVSTARKTGMVAEVLRLDRVRDVALLKLQEVPAWLEIETFPVRLDWPDVGADVYALGTPKDWRAYRGSVSKGIVSAHRKKMKDRGVRLDFIQSDVGVHPGSSGGALVDEYGNLVGLSVRGANHGGDVGIGLNLFVPIQEALDVLDVAY